MWRSESAITLFFPAIQARLFARPLSGVEQRVRGLDVPDDADQRFQVRGCHGRCARRRCARPSRLRSAAMAARYLFIVGLGLVGAFVSGMNASAAEIKVSTARLIATVLREIGREFELETGHKL